MNKELALIALQLVLIIAAVALTSWVAFATFMSIGIGYLSVFVLNRLKPEHVPAPDAAYLIQAFEQHKEETQRDIHSLRGKLELANKAQPFGRRE